MLTLVEKYPVVGALLVEDWTGDLVVGAVVGRNDVSLLDVGVAEMSSLLANISVNSFEGVEVNNVLSEGLRVDSMLVVADNG